MIDGRVPLCLRRGGLVPFKSVINQMFNSFVYGMLLASDLTEPIDRMSCTTKL
jgi:hypothetical protein